MWRTCFSLFNGRKMPPNSSISEERRQSLIRRILAINASRVENEIMPLQGIMILLLPLLQSTMKWRGNKRKVYRGARMSRGSLHMIKASCRHLRIERNRFMQPWCGQLSLMAAQLGCRTITTLQKPERTRGAKTEKTSVTVCVDEVCGESRTESDWPELISLLSYAFT